MGIDPGFRHDPFSSLRALYAKVDDYWTQATRHVGMRCEAGCVSCCHVVLSVCRVEADFIMAGVRGESHAPESSPGTARGNEPGRAGRRTLGAERTSPPSRGDLCPAIPHWVLGPPETPACALLSPGGLCRIYPRRPLICRSHGLPVFADGDTDVCPANRHVLGVVEPLNIELLNTLLFSIDAVYCRARHVEPGRVSLVALADLLFP